MSCAWPRDIDVPSMDTRRTGDVQLVSDPSMRFQQLEYPMHNQAMNPDAAMIGTPLDREVRGSQRAMTDFHMHAGL